jgi:hypothetical protein
MMLSAIGARVTKMVGVRVTKIVGARVTKSSAPVSPKSKNKQCVPEKQKRNRY